MMDVRRQIPAIDRLLGSEAFASVLSETPRSLVREALQAVQDDLRRELAAGGDAPVQDAEWYVERVRARLESKRRPSLRPVINATGVVLHTNLGRAPLPTAALEAIRRIAAGYANLEYDLDAGDRGSRYDHCAALLTELTGAEAALVVNNNAAALVVALNTLAEGREAVVSRGELVEIGGSFRIPEIMARSGARMREVGSTNRTHRRDYEAAITPETGVLLKVHRSNFKILGFSAEVDLGTLVYVARGHGVPVLNDLGSGLLIDLTAHGLPYEPTVGEALRQGADVVTLSGDKLLGGPQAGILLGRRDLIAKMRANPLSRAFRPDKLALAALEATLALYRDPETALREVPVLRMLTMPIVVLADRARAWVLALRREGIAAEAVEGRSMVGGGAYPEAELPTVLVAIASERRSAREIEAKLRTGEPAVVARILDGRVVLDPRTVAPEEEAVLLRRVTDVAA